MKTKNLFLIFHGLYRAFRHKMLLKIDLPKRVMFPESGNELSFCFVLIVIFEMLFRFE